MYHGVRLDKGLSVTIDGRFLPKRLDLVNHSPTGFECGYNGSGPAQLALAILADYFADNHQALMFYQGFKRAVIAKLPRDRDWKLTKADVDAALTELEWG